MITELILAWKNPKMHEWISVGKLAYDNNKSVFFFNYTNSAKLANQNGDFTPFGKMNNLSQQYESCELFPIFKNRLLQKTRPEYNCYLEWLDLTEKELSPLDELARSGGIRATDSLQLFPVPKKKNNKYQVTFFSHGMRHLSRGYIERIGHLSLGSKLYLMKDIQNSFDACALVLRTEDPPEIVGYVPRFFSKDINKLMDKNGAKNVIVEVGKININAPLQFQLLCKLSSPWPNNFEPFDDDSIQNVE